MLQEKGLQGRGWQARFDARSWVYRNQPWKIASLPHSTSVVREDLHRRPLGCHFHLPETASTDDEDETDLNERYANRQNGPRRAPKRGVMALPVLKLGSPVGHEEDRRGRFPMN